MGPFKSAGGWKIFRKKCAGERLIRDLRVEHGPVFPIVLLRGFYGRMLLLLDTDLLDCINDGTL